MKVPIGGGTPVTVVAEGNIESGSSGGLAVDSTNRVLDHPHERDAAPEVTPSAGTGRGPVRPKSWPDGPLSPACAHERVPCSREYGRIHLGRRDAASARLRSPPPPQAHRAGWNGGRLPRRHDGHRRSGATVRRARRSAVITSTTDPSSRGSSTKRASRRSSTTPGSRRCSRRGRTRTASRTQWSSSSKGEASLTCVPAPSSSARGSGGPRRCRSPSRWPTPSATCTSGPGRTGRRSGSCTATSRRRT